MSAKKAILLISFFLCLVVACNLGPSLLSPTTTPALPPIAATFTPTLLPLLPTLAISPVSTINPTLSIPTLNIPTLGVPTLSIPSLPVPTPVFPTESNAAVPIAVFPLYDSPGGFLLGAVQAGKWLDAPAAALQMQGGERYTLYSARSSLGQATGDAPVSEMICPDFYSLRLPHKAEAVLASAGNWNALPRQPQEISPDNPTYRQVVADFLAGNQLPSPEVHVDRILKVDLEGDGTEETILAASRFIDSTGHDVSPGDYSVVLLRRIGGKSVETLAFTASIYTQAKSLAFPDRYVLSGLFDLNGDGKMEVVVSLAGWEKSGARVFEVGGDGIKQVLKIRCP